MTANKMPSSEIHRDDETPSSSGAAAREISMKTSQTLKNKVFGVQPKATDLDHLNSIADYMDQYGNVDTVLGRIFENSSYSQDFIDGVSKNVKIRKEIAFALAQASSETRGQLIGLEIATRIQSIADTYHAEFVAIETRAKQGVWNIIAAAPANDEKLKVAA